MTVSAVQASAGSQQSKESSSATSATGNYKMFLQLLMTELKNQDPTKPVDPTQTVTQLATFSSLEQAVKTNDLLTSLNTQSTLSQGSALIGRTITSADGKVSGSVHSITFTDSGLVANLSDGSQVQVGSGVSVAGNERSRRARDRSTHHLVSGPLVGAAMAVGIVIALLQALTQVQETTLTFVPKIVAMIAVLGFATPYIGSKISVLAQFAYSKIEKGY